MPWGFSWMDYPGHLTAFCRFDWTSSQFIESADDNNRRSGGYDRERCVALMIGVRCVDDWGALR
jgi:hypothetical protein